MASGHLYGVLLKSLSFMFVRSAALTINISTPLDVEGETLHVSLTPVSRRFVFISNDFNPNLVLELNSTNRANVFFSV